MIVRIALAAAVALTPAALAAEKWKEVDRLPGDIAVELDLDSLSEAMDGANVVLLGTFRRQMPTGIMETDVAMDCANATTRLRGLRLVNDGNVYNQAVPPTLDYHSVTFGSGDAIYFKALCELDIPSPDAYVIGQEPVLDAAPDQDAHPLDENPVLDDLPAEDGAE